MTKENAPGSKATESASGHSHSILAKEAEYAVIAAKCRTQRLVHKDALAEARITAGGRQMTAREQRRAIERKLAKRGAP